VLIGLHGLILLCVGLMCCKCRICCSACLDRLSIWSTYLWYFYQSHCYSIIA